MTTPAETLRRAVVGVPYDPGKRPSPLGTVQAFDELAIVVQGITSGALIRDSKANLDAITAAAAHTMAWVFGDATIANNGVYENTGTDTVTVWTRMGPLPYSQIPLVNTGGTNAITATSTLPVSSVALMSLDIDVTNTAAMTLSINGAAAKSLRSSTGVVLAAGSLIAGAMVLLLDAGSTYVLLSDYASAANLALAEAAKDAAEDARDLAAAYANTAISSGTSNSYGVHTGFSAISVPVGVLDALLTGYSAVGDGGQKRIKRVVSAPAGGGVRSADRFLPNGTTSAGNGGWWQITEEHPNILQFGGVDDNVTSNYAAFTDAKAYLGSTGKSLHLPFRNTGIYYVDPNDGAIDLRGMVVDLDLGVQFRGQPRFDAEIRVKEDIPVQYEDAVGLTYDNELLPKAQGRQPHLKENFLHGGDIERKVLTALDFDDYTAEKISLQRVTPGPLTSASAGPRTRPHASWRSMAICMPSSRRYAAATRCRSALTAAPSSAPRSSALSAAT
jgi:hypothetical protein